MHQWLRMIPMFGFMGIIFFLSHQPGSNLSLPSFPGADKIAHAVAYGLLAALVLRALSPRLRRQYPERAAGLSLFICVVYGISDEIHQAFIPGRDASLGDLAADAAGAAIVCAIWLARARNSATL